MKRPPTDIIDLTRDENRGEVQIQSDSAKPPQRSNSKSSSRAASKSRDELEDTKPRSKKKRKLNGEEVDATDSGRSRGPSRASSKAPLSTKGKGAPSRSEESVHEAAPVSKTGGGSLITVEAQNVGFFIDTRGDADLQHQEGSSSQATTDAQSVEARAVKAEIPDPNNRAPTISSMDIPPTAKSPKSPPQTADGSETSGAATPAAPLDAEEDAGQPESKPDNPKTLTKKSTKKARRRERERMAAELAARTDAQAQDNLASTSAGGESALLFFEDMEGFTVAEHLQPDPVEEPLPAFITVDGLTLPRHVKLEKGDTKPKAETAKEDGDSDESSSEESDDEIESDDDDDDRPKKGRRYWLTEDQLAAIPPCGVCGEQGHDYKDCTHLKHCHTLWRSYTYLQPEDRDEVIASRRVLEGVPLLQGGEGYIGTARWCCICGDPGHFGYDCDNLEHPLRKKGPMAFSDQLLRKGPFGSARPYLSAHSRDPTANGVQNYFSDVPGPSMPTNPGAQGKKKHQQQLQNARKKEDEEDDWFNRRDNRAAPSSKGKAIEFEIKNFREREETRRQREETELRRRADDERRRRDRSRERYRDSERDSYRRGDRDDRRRDGDRRRDYDRDYYDDRRRRLDDGRWNHDRHYDDRRSNRREQSPPRKGKSLLDRMSVNLSRR
ncbi:hypothetical protein FS837_006253 [Tulasnella sp. UAMH 9824]|nr:hypothetical protein FS837_006253 [Tulasnella sp. UAMH 9824]